MEILGFILTPVVKAHFSPLMEILDFIPCGLRPIIT